MSSLTRGIVQHDHMGLAPSCPFQIKPLDQVDKEDLHNVTIVVGLDKAVEYLPVGIQGGNHGNSWHHL